MTRPRVLLILSLLVCFTTQTFAEDKSPDVEAAKKAAELAKKKLDATVADVTQGALRIVGEDATVIECPLEHTDVQADVSGFIARVKVTQTFRNPTKERIEAVYVFPLPNEAAVDDMTMVIGDRRIVGLIKRRARAREIYHQAIASGKTAALLEQERPNIFTQSVGNIDPGQEINIEISYVDVLKYDQGSYEFHFPMVIGPRFNPQPSPGAPAVKDAGKINPPILRPGTRTSHDISLTVNLDAGVPIQNLSNANHKVHTKQKGPSQARVRLLQADSVPNKDFVLRYEVVGEKPEMALLAHTGNYSGDAKQMGEGYFMLMIQPKEDERLKKSPPREIVFMVDVSGSMRGQPTDKTKDAMRNMLKLCRKEDTMQVVTFASQANKLFDAPVEVNDGNIKRALNFTNGFKGSGGTRMLEGVKMAIDQPIDEKRIRIVVMLTDGKIGNEAEIIRHVGENCGDQIRFWCVGIGASPNMFLVDGVAKQGGGMGKRLALNDDTVALTTKIMTRIQRAQLSNVQIDWGKLAVTETFPTRIPELWAGRPVIVFGRYKNGGEAEIKISGKVEGEPTTWPLMVSIPAEQKANDVLAKTWARRKIDDLMHQTYYQGSPAVEEEVTGIALDYRLMSQYTSFVAVDEKDADKIDEPVRPPRRMTVPVPLPEGTQWEGFFGEGGGDARAVRDLDRVAVSGSATRRSNAVPLFGGGNKRMDSVESRIAQYELAFRMQSYAPVVEEYFKPMASADGYALGLQLQMPRSARDSLRRRYQKTESLRGLNALYLMQQQGQDRGWAYQPGFQPVNAEALKLYGEQIKSAMESAAKLIEHSKFEEARAQLTLAYYLDMPLQRFGTSIASAPAVKMLRELREKEIEKSVESTPALSQKLDLVIRNKSLAEALTLVCKQAKLDIHIVEGSLSDVDMVAPSAARIAYLDLRNTTVAEALEWIAQPAQLVWTSQEKQISVSSTRRRGIVSPWLYDVSLIATPLADELKGLEDHTKLKVVLKKKYGDLINGIRRELKLDEKTARLDGQLMIMADAETHAKVDQLLANLADAKYQPTKELADLHKATSGRAEARSKAVESAKKSKHETLVKSLHEQNCLTLLTAASRGKLDLEALTKLQIAWQDPMTIELLETRGTLSMLRSLWAICESARMLPGEHELSELASLAKRTSKKSVEKLVVKLSSSQNQADAFAIFYAALAYDDAKGEIAKRARAIAESKDVVTAQLSGVLFGDKMPGDDLFFAQMNGGDAVLLTALACRQAGAWNKFRPHTGRVLGQQPLDGNVVVLVNRLSR